MKLSVNSKVLDKALSRVFPGVPSKTMNPVVENFSIQVVDGLLYVTATNEEIFLQCNLPVTADEDFDLLTNAKLFYDIIHALPDTMLTIESIDHSRLQIKTDTGVYHVNYSNEETFPQIPVVSHEHEFTIPGAQLKRVIDGTSFAIDKNNQTRMAITGLLLDFTADGLILVGTDGHKLVKRALKEFQSENPEQIVVPEKTVAILSKILDDQAVTLFHNATFVHFQMPEVYLISKLITQKYPAYNNVIPLENENLLTVDRAPFVEAVRRMLLFSNPRFQQIRLSIKEDLVELFSEDANSQSSGLDTLPCEYSGTPMDISFNPSFLQEILSHLDSPKVVFQLDTPTRASVILPTENKNENEEVLSLLMPVRLTSYS